VLLALCNAGAFRPLMQWQQQITQEDNHKLFSRDTKPKIKMKAISHFTFALFTPIIASVPNSQVSHSRKVIVPSFKSPSQRIFTLRNLVSEECKDDQETLDGIFGGHLIQYHLESVIDTDNLPEGCFVESTAYVCDFRSGSLSRDFKAQCEDEGGIFEEFDVDLECMGLSAVLKAAPGCISQSCGVEEYITYNEEMFNSTLPTESSDSECKFSIIETEDDSSAGESVRSKWQYYAVSIPIILSLL
jgi:hypothetical protein